MSSSFHQIADGSRVIGYVAIDSTVGGRARGGLRIAHDFGADELRSAARAMTLKYGLLGLPQGGAKAGIIGDAEAPAAEKRRLLHEFARAAEPLLRERTYIPEVDLGTNAADIRGMMESVRIRVGRREWTANRSGDYTARSCLASARALLDRLGTPLEGCRVAIEGFGKVGSPLASLLHDRGARVVALSTSRGALYREEGLNVPLLVRRAAEVGGAFIQEQSDRIEAAALLELPVDLLLPCARFHSIDAGNVARVHARAICAGANGPVSPAAERVLFERGVPYPPDFLTNCGGVLGGTLEFAGVPFDRICHFIEGCVRQWVTDLLDRSENLGATPRSVAEAEALTRHATVRAQAEHPSAGQRVVALAIEAYRRRWVPQKLVSVMATRYLARGFATELAPSIASASERR
jgi:glutamate dehydrogenase/leucine dehydrogenase